MNKQEMKEKFEKNIQYLHRNIPPDDIYAYSEQTFMAAMFFLRKWVNHVDILEECKNDPVVKKWVTNLVGMEMCKDQEIDINLDLNLQSLEEDENNN